MRYKSTATLAKDQAFNANLGKAASQDDLSLQAIIPWGLKDAE
jgi:hypothetical protein